MISHLRKGDKMKNYLFVDQDIEQLKKDIYTVKRPVFNRLVDQCKLYFNEQLPEEHPKASTTYMGIAIANLSLAYILTEQEHYLKEAKRWIMTVVSYPHWGNAHLVDVDLSAAWILFGLGIAYDWLENDFSREEEKLVREKIILQGDRMYDFKIKTEGSGWSTNYFQNHNWINMTGLASAGYALINKYDDDKKWVENAKDNFNTVYSMLPEDGSDYEGVVYWRYGAMWLFVYAHMLKEREKINYFESCDFLRHTFDYRLYQAAPNLEEQINFGDCHDRRSGHSTAIYYKVASEYKNGYAQKLGNLVRDQFLYREAYESKVKPGILPECFFEVLFYNHDVEEKDFSDLPLKKYFDDLGLYVHRSSWEKDARHMSFKCGHPGGKTQWSHLWRLKDQGYNCFGLSHQHPDNNSFILVADETYFAIDDGYNRHVKASDHNLVVVDGKGNYDEGQNNIWKNYTQDMIAEMEVADLNDEYSYLVGESAKQYDPTLNLNTYKRALIHTDAPWYFMIDDLSSDDEHTYTWIMHGDHYPKSEGNQHTYINGFGKMTLHQLSNEQLEVKHVDNTIRAVMTTQEPDKFTENRMKALHVSNKSKVKDMTFVSVLVPTSQVVDVKTLEIENGIGYEMSKEDLKETLLVATKPLEYKNNILNTRITLIREYNDQIKVFNLGPSLIDDE